MSRTHRCGPVSSRNASPSPARARESRPAVTILRAFPSAPRRTSAQYIHRPRRELGGSRAPSFPVPRCMHYRPPDDPPTGSCGANWNRPWKVTHGIVRTGQARLRPPISKRTGIYTMLDPRLQLAQFHARQRELEEQAARDRLAASLRTERHALWRLLTAAGTALLALGTRLHGAPDPAP